MVFKERAALGHAYGLARELAIADAQRTRVNDQGTAFMRTGSCNLVEQRTLRIVFGSRTQSITLADDTIASIDYTPERDLCKTR
jgi:hypothetical protein